jgi:CRP-like cAMP-binding protein
MGSERPRADATHAAAGPHAAATVELQARELLRPYLRKRRFPVGSLLFSEGEASGLLVAVDAGRVKIYRLLPAGRAVTVFIFGPGDVFGFLPFLDGEPYPAYAQALDDVEAQVMSRADLLAAVRSDPHVALTLIGLVGRRLREALRRIESVQSGGVLPRVASALAALLPGPHDLSGAGGVISLPVSGAEFAAAIGITPETLSRCLTRLVAARVLHRLGPGRFQVLDPDALLRNARTDAVTRGAPPSRPPTPRP